MNNFKSFYDWCVEEKHMKLFQLRLNLMEQTILTPD